MEFLDGSWFRTRIESESALYREILDYFNSSPELVEEAAREYAEFFRNPKAGEVPRHVAYVWRVHMLHPRQYRADCRKAFGKLVVPFYNDSDFVPQLRMDYERKTTGEGSSADIGTFPSLDLAAGMRRQLRFMRKWKHRSLGAEYIEAAVERFRMWLSLVEKSQGPLVPTLDIDLVWHSLMLCPGKYYELTVAEIGYLMDHDDDTKDESVMKKQVDAAKELWSTHFPTAPFYSAAKNYAECAECETCECGTMCRSSKCYPDCRSSKCRPDRVHADREQGGCHSGDCAACAGGGGLEEEEVVGVTQS